MNKLHTSARPAFRSAAAWILGTLLGRGALRTLLVAALCLLARPTPASLLAGGAIVVAGAALHVWAKGCLRVCAEVTTSGPYAWVRNPFYLANLVLETGYCVAGRRLDVLAVFLAAWLLAYLRTIRREERTLRRLFGPAFDAYRSRVPRLLPWRGRVRGLSASSPFAWDNPNLAEGREYARVARILMALPLVLLAARFRDLGSAAATRPDRGAVLCLVAIAALATIRIAALRRFKEGRDVLPQALLLPRARLAALLVFVTIGSATVWYEIESDLLVGLGVGLTVTLCVSLAAVPAVLGRSAAFRRLAEAAACLVAGIVAEQPWLGMTFATWFVLQAMETGRIPDDGAVVRLPRLRTGLLAALLSSACFVKELIH